MAEQMKALGVNFEDVIRLSSLGTKCKEAREELGLSVKDVSKKLGVPQYRVKAIEKPDESKIIPDVLLKYVEFLELESWFEKWKDANSKLAGRLFDME